MEYWWHKLFLKTYQEENEAILLGWILWEMQPSGSTMLFESRILKKLLGRKG